MVLSTLVRKYDSSTVVHLLEPAINQCLYGDLCNLGIQYRYGDVTHDKRHANFRHLADGTKVKSCPRPKVTKVGGNIDKT